MRKLKASAHIPIVILEYPVPVTACDTGMSVDGVGVGVRLGLELPPPLPPVPGVKAEEFGELVLTVEVAAEYGCAPVVGVSVMTRLDGVTVAGPGAGAAVVSPALVCHFSPGSLADETNWVT